LSQLDISVSAQRKQNKLKADIQSVCSYAIIESLIYITVDAQLLVVLVSNQRLVVPISSVSGYINVIQPHVASQSAMNVRNADLEGSVEIDLVTLAFQLWVFGTRLPPHDYRTSFIVTSFLSVALLILYKGGESFGECSSYPPIYVLYESVNSQ